VVAGGGGRGPRPAAARAPGGRGREDGVVVRRGVRTRDRPVVRGVPARGRGGSSVTAFSFEVLVTLKDGLADPQGKAVESALPALGWSNVSQVRVGKHIRLEVDASDVSAARAQVEEMATRLLSNPVIEDAQVLEGAS